jgi:hypothetical protein
MASLDQAYSTPLAAITSATRDNAAWPKKLKLPDSIDTDIDYSRWNKLYPYALVMATPTNDFADVVWGFGGDWRAAANQIAAGAGGSTFYKEQARFVLPISPEQLSVQTPYAIQVSKTLGGVVEEHNADPFRIISFTGTTGVNPLRAQSRTTKNNNLFGGIVEAASNTASAASSLTSTLGFGSSLPKPPTPTDIEQGTGYGQFRLLEIFLQSYVRIKQEGNKKMRLLFVTYKDQKAYVVTPMQFTMRREAGRALKYRYDLQLKAWKQVPSRMVLTGGGLGDLVSSGSGGFSIGAILSTIKDTLDNVRKVIAGAVSIVRNIRAAVSQLLDIVREVALAAKEAIGAVKTLIDMPNQIIQDCKQAFRDSWENIKSAWDDLGNSIDQAKADLGIKRTGNIVGFIDRYFADPTTPEAIDFLSRADLSKLTLTPALQNQVNDEIARVAAFTNEDYATRRDTVRSIAAQISDAIGASSVVYDTTYQNIHATTTHIPTQGDWDVVFAVNDTLRSLNTLSQQESTIPTTMEYVAGFANKSGVAFQTPVSKYPIPFPFDYTLEELSRQYLGSPDRWLEIATLNGLREPYVDEVGFVLPLLGNGKLSQVIVSSSTNLTIGQPVWLQSNTINREKRHILNIKDIGPGNTVLTLDGAGDLAKYVVADSPYMQAFLPDTVNSQQLIYIPSDVATLNDESLKDIPGVDAFDSLLEVGGVDLLLDNNNDLAITDDGDCRVAFGMSNLVQRARIALSTPRGTLLRHPDFGLPIKVGSSVADLDMPELKSAVADIFTSDPSFDGTTSVSVLENGATLQIGLGLSVTGQKHPISVAFQVRR